MKSLAVLLALMPLAACVESDPSMDRNFYIAYTNCARITAAKGSYTVGKVGANGLPTIVKGAGADDRGALLMNECIAQNMGTTASPKVVKPVKAKPGKLALPVQYPLLPGDAELWDTLTLAQQQRAMEFLKDGGTIRASLNNQ